MIGAIVGAAAAIGSSIAGGINAARQRRKMRRDLQRRQDENLEWYKRNYNEDATLRADAQQAINTAAEAAKDRTRRARGVQSVVGGTDEALAAREAANSEAIARTASNIAAEAADRKDKIEENYLNRRDALADKQQQMREQNAQDIAEATTNTISAAGTLATGIDDMKAAEGKAKTSSAAEPKASDATLSSEAARRLFRGEYGFV